MDLVVVGFCLQLGDLILPVGHEHVLVGAAEALGDLEDAETGEHQHDFLVKVFGGQDSEGKCTFAHVPWYNSCEGA